jgi:arsenate reductase
MAEIGIDIAMHRSKHVDEFSRQSFDYVLTLCDNAHETCPVFPAGAARLHRSFDDPAAAQGPEEERLRAFRHVRDQLRDYLAAVPPSG